jgi:transcription elongation GreA/GreB family factor
MIDKSHLLRAVIRQLEEGLERLGTGYTVARQATLDSPHVMKSKREVAGIEASYLANALAGQIEERLAWLRILRSLRLPEPPARVVLGSVVGVGPEGGPATQHYFLLPVCGGLEVVGEGGAPAVRVITPETPLARSLIGKAAGEQIPPLRAPGTPLVLLLLL